MLKKQKSLYEIARSFVSRQDDPPPEVPSRKSARPGQTNGVSTEDTYALKRDFHASSRLLAQHNLWKADLGYLIHPSIPVPAKPRIADVACGNGCWLLDVASTLRLPYALRGFDISLDQVPTTGLDPSAFPSVRFCTWNIFNEPPSDYVGAFDIVHIRLITVIFRDNDPIPVIESLKKLLKPGGYLQWEEVDNVDFSVLNVKGGEETPALEQIVTQLCSSGKGDWKQHGAHFLNQNGFANAKQYHIAPSNLNARFWTDNYLSTWSEYVAKVLGQPEKAKILSEDAMREVRRGAAIRIPLWVWVAQKSDSLEADLNRLDIESEPPPRHEPRHERRDTGTSTYSETVIYKETMPDGHTEANGHVKVNGHVNGHVNGLVNGHGEEH